MDGLILVIPISIIAWIVIIIIFLRTYGKLLVDAVQHKEDDD